MGSPRCSTVLALAAAALGLTGCFTSDQPLLDAGGADYPFRSGAHFTESINCAQPGAGLLACDGQGGYRQIATGALAVENGRYRLDYDKDSNPVFSLPAAQGAQPPRMLFKAVGEGLYVVQLDMGPQGAEGAPGVMPRYLYSLIRVEGGTAFVYKYLCEENGDRRYVQTGQLAAVELDVLGMATCRANDIQGLAAIFRDRLANNPTADEKIDIARKAD